jgi:hypothetical protein
VHRRREEGGHRAQLRDDRPVVHGVQVLQHDPGVPDGAETRREAPQQEGVFARGAPAAIGLRNGPHLRGDPPHGVDEVLHEEVRIVVVVAEVHPGEPALWVRADPLAEEDGLARAGGRGDEGERPQECTVELTARRRPVDGVGGDELTAYDLQHIQRRFL